MTVMWWEDGRVKRGRRPHVITDARQSPGEELRFRERRYVLMMSIRAVCLVAAAVTRAMGSVLYGISAADPVSWTAAAALLLAVSTLANFIPAHRASRVSPTEALRTE